MLAMISHYYPPGVKNRRGASTRLLTVRHYAPARVINGPRHRVIILAP